MSKKCHNRADSWDRAIGEAEAVIVEAQRRIAQMEEVIKNFRELRDRGQPFPGEKPLRRSRRALRNVLST